MLGGLIAIANQGRAGAGEATLSSSGGVEGAASLYRPAARRFQHDHQREQRRLHRCRGLQHGDRPGDARGQPFGTGLIAYQGISPANLMAANQPTNPIAACSSSVSGGSCNVFNVFDVVTAGSQGADHATLLGHVANPDSLPAPVAQAKRWWPACSSTLGRASRLPARSYRLVACRWSTTRASRE